MLLRPAPSFKVIKTVDPGFSQATLFAPKKLNDMEPEDRVRACYQHACLCSVSGKMTMNNSLREWFGIEPKKTRWSRGSSGIPLRRG